MGTSLFSWVNAIDGASLAAGDQVVTLPVANLADPKIQKLWRSGTSTATFFTADLRSAISLGVIGLFGCNLSSTDTVRIRLSNVAVGSSELLDTTALASGIADGYGQYVYVPAAAISARYLRVDINAPSRASYGNFDIGRAWAGPVWNPAVNFSLGWGEDFEDPSVVTESPRSGAAFVDTQAKRRVMALGYDFLSPADKDSAMDLARQAGRSGQLLFVPDTAGSLAKGPLLGRKSEDSKVLQSFNSYPAIYAKSFTLRQDL